MTVPRLDRVEARAYRIPTEAPESDGTFAWDSTTLVVVHAEAAGTTGFGYTYGSAAAVTLIRDALAPRVVGRSAFAVEDAWNALVGAVRNLGRPGIASTAIAAIDVALWDLKARLLGLPLVALLGEARPAVPVYGSGGFTSMDTKTLCAQLAGWVEQGIGAVKMKVGTHPDEDGARVAAARRAIGDGVVLMVDANGAYGRAQAAGLAQTFVRSGVSWFEEPVPMDDRDGLRAVRERAPGGMEIAAGEYGWGLVDFRGLLEAGAVDVLQADASRCCGITGFMAAARLCQAFGVPLSSHTAPTLHAHPACAATALRHVEYFSDHVRIEERLFDGFVAPRRGLLEPDRSRPGIGVTFKSAHASRWQV
jgi:L-alanine-DL-glutamate epimerase-like enolase superfamily enzyme